MSDQEISNIMGGPSGRDRLQEMSKAGKSAAEFAEELLSAINPADPINLLGGAVIKVASTTVLAFVRTSKVARETMEGLASGERFGGNAGNSLRAQARRFWYAQGGVPLRQGGLEIHHRIPLEWSHLFPESYPNRLSNLMALPDDVHGMVTTDWRVWKFFQENSYGRTVTADMVVEMANRVDRLYGSSAIPLQ